MRAAVEAAATVTDAVTPLTAGLIHNACLSLAAAGEAVVAMSPSPSSNRASSL